MIVLVLNQYDFEVSVRDLDRSRLKFIATPSDGIFQVCLLSSPLVDNLTSLRIRGASGDDARPSVLLLGKRLDALPQTVCSPA